MADRFSRWLGGPDDVPCLMYTKNTETGRPVLGCPACGHRFELPLKSGPDGNGLTPHAIKCGSLACAWWEPAQLDDYWLTVEECE